MISAWQWTGFDWDAGNRDKNTKHRVSDDECEEVFFNLPLLLGPDEAHSQHEDRRYAFGQTNGGRRLFITFTIRRTQMRIISARAMTRKERKTYDEAEKADP